MTSEPKRPLTQVEVPDENEVSECRHEERCSEVPGMSDDEGEVQGRDGEEEGRAAKPARDLGAPTTAEIAKHAVTHWPYRSSLHCIRGRGSSRQCKTDKGWERTIPALSADCCFTGGVNGSP